MPQAQPAPAAAVKGGRPRQGGGRHVPAAAGPEYPRRVPPEQALHPAHRAAWRAEMSGRLADPPSAPLRVDGNDGGADGGR